MSESGFCSIHPSLALEIQHLLRKPKITQAFFFPLLWGRLPLKWLKTVSKVKPLAVVQISSPPLTICVTMNKLHNLSESLFSIANDNGTISKGCLSRHIEALCVKSLSSGSILINLALSLYKLFQRFQSLDHGKPGGYQWATWHLKQLCLMQFISKGLHVFIYFKNIY